MRKAILLATVAVGGMGLFALGQLSQPEAHANKKEKTGSANLPAKGQMPPQKLTDFLDGLHVQDGEPDHQMDVAHFCTHQSPDLIQCALFDKAGPDARLVGIEYVITPKLLGQLPEEERALWHSHSYEVTSGMLAAPGLPASKEKALMKTLAGTYGKTWHTWQTEQSAQVPVGYPTLMMAFTKDGQVKPSLIEARDARYGIDTEALAARRKDITPPEIMAGVNRGEDGKSCRTETEQLKQPVRGTEEPEMQRKQP